MPAVFPRYWEEYYIQTGITPEADNCIHEQEVVTVSKTGKYCGLWEFFSHGGTVFKCPIVVFYTLQVQVSGLISKGSSTLSGTINQT